MNIKVKDIVKLIKENPQTRANKIKVGEIGVVVHTNLLKDESMVAFLDFENYKARAIVTVKNDMIEKQNKVDKDCNGNEFGYLDEVMIISDKYEKLGIKIGTKGVVVLQNGMGKSLVDFTAVQNNKVTGEVVTVKNEDLKKI